MNEEERGTDGSSDDGRRGRFYSVFFWIASLAIVGGVLYVGRIQGRKEARNDIFSTQYGQVQRIAGPRLLTVRCGDDRYRRIKYADIDFPYSSTVPISDKAEEFLHGLLWDEWDGEKGWPVTVGFKYKKRWFDWLRSESDKEAYVYVDGTSVNFELVRNGFARVKAGVQLGSWLIAAQHEAIHYRRGIWADEQNPICLIASKKQEVFHSPFCTWVQKIKAENIVYFGTYADAVKSGRRPCKVCRPSKPIEAPLGR